MKPPKLPGTEKFKFCDKRYEELRKNSSNNCDSVKQTIFTSNFNRGIPVRSTCPSKSSSLADSPSSQSPFIRYDSIRRPVFPISGRMSSRVLTLTHLPLDSLDFRANNSWHKNCVNTSRRLSIACDSRQSMSAGSRVSLLSDSSGSHCSSLSSAQPSPRSSVNRTLCPTQWAKSAHRLSTSSQSSCETTSGSESTDTFWTLRK